MGEVRILEIGCGPGQFAELLFNRGIRNYTGFDFSPVAIDKARERTPAFTFEVQDARDASVWRRGFDCAICLEVLEHIVDDRSVLAAIPPGTRSSGVCRASIRRRTFGTSRHEPK